MLPLVFLIIIIAALLVLIPGLRERVVEKLKNLSDAWIIEFLRGTSRFGVDLTDEGRAEQRRWSEQRMRNLRGLTLRSKQALSSRRSGEPDRSQ